MAKPVALFVIMVTVILVLYPTRAFAYKLRGRIVDDATGEAVAARLYVNQGGAWYFARSVGGQAVAYNKERPGVPEKHTVLSGDPFEMDLAGGTYTVTVECGKEYQVHAESVSLGADKEITIRLKRWIDMNDRGWYAGETHVHCTPGELKTLQVAENINVAFPLSSWVEDYYKAPPNPGGSSDPVYLDGTHVTVPLNTEWEPWRVSGGIHHLGAAFALGQTSPVNAGVPPVKSPAEQVHAQGALLDMDKIAWPWSTMIVPIMHPDLFELFNNHVWRAGFYFNTYDGWVPPPDYMDLEKAGGGVSEWGWIEYGFQSYYALLNCGFRFKPTAGTASGVHPVPFGFSRVYVHVDGAFTYEKWLDGLAKGNSFATTGPMIFAAVNGAHADHVFTPSPGQLGPMAVAGRVESAMPLDRIEIVRNGLIHARLEPSNDEIGGGVYRSAFDEEVDIDGTSWIAVRAFEGIGGGRFRYAHTAPWHIDVESRPLFPSQEQINFLIDHTRTGLDRNRAYFDAQSIAEHEEALAVYRDIEQRMHTFVGVKHRVRGSGRECISADAVAGVGRRSMRIGFPNQRGHALVSVYRLDGRRVARRGAVAGNSVNWNPGAIAGETMVIVVQTGRRTVARRLVCPE